MDKLTGKIINKADISGKIIAKASVSGKVGIPYGSTAYTGEYTVIPDALEEQILKTANKTLIEDVTVKKIPYHETSNPSGGKTIVIAQEE
jgi:hypothetical protein